MKHLRLLFASLLSLAACALPCAAQARGFTLEQVPSSPFPEFEQIVFTDDVRDFLLHRHWLRAYAASADFFDRQLRGQQR